MKSLCRFCLTTCDEDSYQLLSEDSEVYAKIRVCLTVQITFNTYLPNHLCQNCIDFIAKIEEFCSKVKQNEEKLQQCLLNNSLQDFYLQISKQLHIKTENSENTSITAKYTDGKQINDKTEGIVKLELNCNENNERDFSSDDEIALSSLKQEQDYSNISENNIKNELETKCSTNKININAKNNLEHQTKSNVTIENSILDNPFRCLTCDILCSSQPELHNHYNNKHLNKHKKLELKFQKCVSNGNVTYKCDICDKTCKTNKLINDHMRNHNKERPFICKLCGRTYKTVTEIIRHGRVHSGIRLHCSFRCGYSTAYSGALKLHENRHQNEYKPKYTCEKCGKGFQVKTWYEQHQNIHNGLKPFSCDLCPQTFHMDRYLQSHKSAAHPQLITVGRFVCVHCDKKCDSVKNLAVHLEEHGIENKKGFLCHYCGKIMSTSSRLKVHHKIHLGVKPYTCSICNKSFAKNFTLKQHISAHAGEKSHACRCGKRYAQRSTLRRHINTHHRELSSKTEQ